MLGEEKLRKLLLAAFLFLVKIFITDQDAVFLNLYVLSQSLRFIASAAWSNWALSSQISFLRSLWCTFRNCDSFTCVHTYTIVTVHRHLLQQSCVRCNVLENGILCSMMNFLFVSVRISSLHPIALRMLVLTIVDNINLIFYNNSSAVAVTCDNIIIAFNFLFAFVVLVFVKGIDSAVETLIWLLQQALVFKLNLL